MSYRDAQAANSGSFTTEASLWLVRLHADDVTDAEIGEWLRWSSASPGNLQAFDEVQQLYDQLRGVAPADRQPFLELTKVSNESKSVLSTIATYAQKCWTGYWQVLALGTGSLLAIAMLFWLRPHSAKMETQNYQVALGSQQSLTLPDRSRVTLGGASDVTSFFSSHIRRVELHHGEAFFEVQHDRGRPFVVAAVGLTVTAVGTQFDVRETGARTVVVVAQGAVDVSIDDSASPGSTSMISALRVAQGAPVRIQAGQQAVRESGRRGLIVSDTDPMTAAAWRQGRLAYIMEPLGSVIEDVNRYSARHIVVRDPKINDLMFTGTIFRDHIDTWAMNLVNVFPLVITPAVDGSLQFTLRPASSTLDFR